MFCNTLQGVQFRSFFICKVCEPHMTSDEFIGFRSLFSSLTNLYPRPYEGRLEVCFGTLTRYSRFLTSGVS